MEIVTELLRQGALGILAGAALYLFLQERKDHREDKKVDNELIRQLYDARLAEHKENTRNVTDVLQSNTEAMRILTEKIQVAKQNGSM